MAADIPPKEETPKTPDDETISISTTVPAAEPNATLAEPTPETGVGVLGAVTALWVSLGSIWKGRTVEAFRLGSTTKNFWVVGFLIYSLILGLLTATTASRSIGSADELLGSMSGALTGYSSRGMFSLSAGNWISLLLVGVVMGFIAFLLRALCLKWTFSVRGVPRTMGATSTIITTSYAMQMVVLLGATVLLMVPSAAISGLVLLLIGLVSVPLALISELLIYIGLNRSARFEKSALIPHALFTGVWIALTVIAYAIMFSVFLENVF